MRVALRADASSRIGTGHLRRCLSLAQSLAAEGVETLLVCRDHDETSRLISATGAAHVLLAPANGYEAAPGDPAHAAWAGTGWQQDADDTIDALRTFAPDWTVVDHYAFDARWHGRVAAALGTRIAVIDDLADRPLAARLVIDPNLHPDPAQKFAACLHSPARVLGGPRYALLAPRYRDAPRYRFRREVRSIGIFMGGADPADFTSQALLACREVARFDGDIELVSSARSPHLARHRELAQRWPGTRVLCDEPDLCAFFARHDLQIGSGGGAAWERSCLGAPTLAIQIAENQRAVLPELAARGAVEWLGDGPPDAAAIGGAVRALVARPRRRLGLVRATRGLVDGLGSARVAAAMALAVQPELQFRDVQARDEALLLDWVNDPEVRGHAFHPEAITPRQHRAWFQARLARPEACAIVIATSRAGTPVGQVRFEQDGGSWTIGYSLDAAFRGSGLARPLLAGAIARLNGRAGPAALEAWVKPDNAASLKTFRGLGFQESRAEHEGISCHRFELPAPGPSTRPAT